MFGTQSSWEVVALLRASTLVGLVLVAASSTVAFADPGAITWAGGTLVLQEAHPSIQLVREHLVFEPTSQATEVTADLWFENRGPSTAAQMGFPTTSYGGSGYHFVTHLVVQSDDKEVPTEKVKAPLTAIARKDAEWYVFDVPFQAGQTRHIRVTYDETHAPNPDNKTPYILSTGGSWAGSIEDLTVEVRMADRRNFSNVSLRTSYDGDELPLTRDGHSLFWQCPGYDGDPAMLWLRYRPGPAHLEIAQEGGRQEVANAWHPLTQKVRWHRGALLAEIEFLGDLLMAKVVRGTWLEKEDVEYKGDRWTLPADRQPEPATFLRLREACKAFGGSVEVSCDEAGDARILIKPPAMTVEAACKTALWRSQDSTHRLRALSFLAACDPQACMGSCGQILGQSGHLPVRLAALGYLSQVARSAPGEPDLSRALATAAARGTDELVEVTLTGSDDMVIRGGGLLLARGGATRAAEALLARVKPDDDHNRWREYQPRGRAAGLALRKVRADDTWQAFRRFAAQHEGSELCEAGMVAMGFLGDDAAIPYLLGAATDPDRDNGDETPVAVSALGYLRTEASVEALASLSLDGADRHIRHRAVMGLEAAIGHSEDGCRFPVPDWAVDISPREAARLARPCIQKLVAGDVDTGRSASSILRTIDEILEKAET